MNLMYVKLEVCNVGLHVHVYSYIYMHAHVYSYIYMHAHAYSYILYMHVHVHVVFPFTDLQQASALSREKKLPRVYIAANSGARIGLAEELKHLYRVAWVDETEPDKGYKYLYLSSADYMKVVPRKSVLS